MQDDMKVALSELAFILRTIPPVSIALCLFTALYSQNQYEVFGLLGLFMINITAGVYVVKRWFPSVRWPIIAINAVLFSGVCWFGEKHIPTWLLFLGPLSAAVFMIRHSLFKVFFIALLVLPAPVIMLVRSDWFDAVGPFGALSLFALFNYRNNFFLNRQKAALSDEREKSDRLLLNVLPPAVAVRMKNGERDLADYYEEASVLFADITGFTPMASELPATRLLEILSGIFAQFDRLVTEAGVTKIKTIGDAYMAAAGVADQQCEHQRLLADLAVKMVDPGGPSGRRLNEAGIRLRIGLHTGPLVAGVIGHERFSYDVWGDTVNTASRLESYGKPGRIHISSEMKAALEQTKLYRFESRGSIEVKGKGQMQTWYLNPAPCE